MKGFLSEFWNLQVHRLGIGLDKGSAARRTSLVQHDVADGSVLDLHALHILAADVQNEGYAGQELFRTLVVSHRFDFAGIDPVSGADQSLAVAGYHRPSYICFFRKLPVHFRQNVPNYRERIALVALIMLKDQFLVPVDESRLGGSRSRINA